MVGKHYVFHPTKKQGLDKLNLSLYNQEVNTR